jgi:hypothetical protein
LEALGIAAMDRWDECLSLWKKSTNGNLDSPANQRIAWRGRGALAAEMQSMLLRNPKINGNEIPALFRALDFQDAESRKKALRALLDLASAN